MNIYKSMIGIIVSIVLLTGCVGKELGRYYDTANKYSIKFPASWKIQAAPAGDQGIEVLTASSPNNAATARIWIQKYGLGTALTIFSKELAEKLGASPPSEGVMTKVDNRPAYAMVCDGSGSGPEFTTFYYCFTMEDKIYSIIFVTSTNNFSTRQPEFEVIAKSFKFGS